MVVFSAGVTSVSFDVLIIDDSILEKPETFTISIDPISLPYGVTLVSPAAATVSIQDDDGEFAINMRNVHCFAHNYYRKFLHCKICRSDLLPNISEL